MALGHQCLISEGSHPSAHVPGPVPSNLRTQVMVVHQSSASCVPSRQALLASFIEDKPEAQRDKAFY